MNIGVPREIKEEEYRVAVTPAGTGELAFRGHRVFVEAGAGMGSGFSDREYESAGAVVTDRETVFENSELIVKVKEPMPEEFPLFHKGQALFTYLHLAANPELVRFLVEHSITALGYETLEQGGRLPLLAPMSEVAGRMVVFMGAYFMQKPAGGRGIFPPGVVGLCPARVLILGAGVVGSNAARVAAGLGLDTLVLNRSIGRLKELDDLYRGRIKTRVLTGVSVEEGIRWADMAIGAVLVPGGRTPVLVRKELVKKMRKGSVVVDVSVDQGGCFETTKPTTHSAPTYEACGIVHYCVANMPGVYPRTSTLALTNATLPFIKIMAGKGIDRALGEEPSLRSAVNIRSGRIVHPALPGYEE
ncbi:MAG TPA: alanine dehydrogenase [Thermodesulfobacteriaceae bacterium]|nr:alanine dehydrogenase [Thermodesulfobacteriaceae bacterium]